MVLGELVIAGLVGLDSYAFVKYLQSRSEMGQKPVPVQQPAASFSWKAGSGYEQTVLSTSTSRQKSTAQLGARLAAIKEAVGEPKFADESAAAEFDDSGPTGSEGTSGSYGGEAGYVPLTAWSTGDYANLSTDGKISYLYRGLESNEEAVRRMNAEFTSIEERIAALETRFAKGEKNAEIDIPIKASAKKNVASRKGAASKRMAG